MPPRMYPVGKSVRGAEPNLTTDVLVGLAKKKQIIHEVIEGHLHLSDAGSQFQVAHKAASICLESATGVPSLAVDRESACRAVIGWVCLELTDRPEYAARVSQRLEGELNELVNRNGGSAPPR